MWSTPGDALVRRVRPHVSQLTVEPHVLLRPSPGSHLYPPTVPPTHSAMRPAPRPGSPQAAGPRPPGGGEVGEGTSAAVVQECGVRDLNDVAMVGGRLMHITQAVPTQLFRPLTRHSCTKHVCTQQLTARLAIISNKLKLHPRLVTTRDK